MGIDPLYLLEGGAIIYVEGASDREIVSEWLRLNLTVPTGIEIHALGGTGKIAEAFARPMFRHFSERLFLPVGLRWRRRRATAIEGDRGARTVL